MSEKKSREIQRYEYCWRSEGMVDEADGLYVLYDHHVAHVARLEGLLEQAYARERNVTESMFGYRSALEFYADVERWSKYLDAPKGFNVLDDRGERAREALARPQESEKFHKSVGKTLDGLLALSQDELMAKFEASKPPPAKSEFEQTPLIDEEGSITLDGEHIGFWNDSRSVDSPEDLIWSRDIGQFAHEMIKAGFNYAMKLRERTGGVK